MTFEIDREQMKKVHYMMDMLKCHSELGMETKELIDQLCEAWEPVHREILEQHYRTVGGNNE